MVEFIKHEVVGLSLIVNKQLYFRFFGQRPEGRYDRSLGARCVRRKRWLYQSWRRFGHLNSGSSSDSCIIGRRSRCRLIPFRFPPLRLLLCLLGSQQNQFSLHVVFAIAFPLFHFQFLGERQLFVKGFLA